MATTNTTSSATEQLTTSSILTSSLSTLTSTTVVTSIPSTTSVPPTSTTFTSTFSQSSQLTTSTVTASSAAPSTTALITSTVNVGTGSSTSLAPIIITVTTTSDLPSSSGGSATTSSGSSSSTTPASLGSGDNGGNGSNGLSPAGRTAVAVVVPVVVVALLVILALFLWRRRKQRKAAAEERRQEVEDYGYNPNSDPTIPVVASDAPAMSEDHNSGYRGWGAATASTRKASTTLSGGHTQQMSDGGSNAYGNSSSPNHSDGNSNTGLMDNRRQTMGSDDFTAMPINNGAAAGLGAGTAGAAAAANGMRRGPSNASSRYSGGGMSDHSEEPVPQIPPGFENHGYGYTQHGPYGDGSYNGGHNAGSGMPVVRDVSARRNTRIQQAGNYQQGNSGIAQNF